MRTAEHRAMMNAAKLSAEELERLLSPEFPRLFHPETGIAILKVWDRGATVRQGFHPRALRPGGTISGASMMMLTDFTMYVAVLAAVGWVPGGVRSARSGSARKAKPTSSRMPLRPTQFRRSLERFGQW